MKAVFKGYKKEACGEFTIGKHYRIEPYYDVEGIFIAIDDKGYRIFFKKGDDYYDFEFLIEDEQLSHNELLGDACNDKKPKLRYYINGHEVDKIYFENVRYEVGRLDKCSVKHDTIEFEVKFK